jgi:hypothetical protein
MRTKVKWLDHLITSDYYDTRTEISRLFSNARLYDTFAGFATTTTGIQSSYAILARPCSARKTRSALISREMCG